MVVRQTRKEHVVRDKSENEGISIRGDSPGARMADGKCVGRRGPCGKMGSARGGGGHVDFLLFCFMPWYEALLRHRGGSSLTSDRLLRSFWFPWQKTTTDNWPSSQGAETLKTSVPAKTGRKVHWWLLFALLINVRPGTPYDQGLRDGPLLSSLHMSVSWAHFSLSANKMSYQAIWYLRT